MRSSCALFAGFLAIDSTHAAEDRTIAVTSPSGKVELKLRVDPAKNQVRYFVTRDGKPVIEPSSIDVRLSNVGSLATGASITNVNESKIDESSVLPWGKTKRIHDRCASTMVRLESSGGTLWDLELRAYDDGIAFRYGLPEQPKLSEFALEDEAIAFQLAADPTILFTTCTGFVSSHEADYQRRPLSKLPDGLLDMPLVAQWPDGTAAAITEARLRNYAGMYLQRREDSRSNVLCSRLSPLLDRKQACVVGKTPHWSPWRVVLLADHPGKLIENNLLLCLNESAAGDFSFAEPGKTTFQWWNGTVTPEIDLSTHREYIDFCAKNHIKYHTVIGDGRPWYLQSGGPGYHPPQPDSDVCTPRPEIQLPQILDYAKEKGVGIRFWVHWLPLSKKLDEAFALYEQWGIRGLMVDFMDRDDQEMIEFQERVLQSAAKHKLHIQFHGSYKPSGEQRTYPNLFNREGVLNEEYSKWSNNCTPAHDVEVAYARLLAGPIDYHLGGFRAATQESFVARDVMPLVMGTRCHQLALYVIYENPMPMVADTPDAYEGQPGFDFLVRVPTTWDETRFVIGDLAEYVFVARRHDRDWYLGGITNWTRRDVNIPLEFLDDGTYRATTYADGSLDEADPNAILQERREVTSASSLPVRLAPGGGFVAFICPNNN